MRWSAAEVRRALDRTDVLATRGARVAAGPRDSAAGLEFRPYMAVVMADFLLRHGELAGAGAGAGEQQAELASLLRQPRRYLSQPARRPSNSNTHSKPLARV